MVSDRRTEVHPTVLRDVTTAALDSEAHAVEHAEVGERCGVNHYNIIVDCRFALHGEKLRCVLNLSRSTHSHFLPVGLPIYGLL